MIDPKHLPPTLKLTRPKSFEQWRERMFCRLVSRVSQADFDEAFDAVVMWMTGREIALAQARWSANDIIIAMTRCVPWVIIQKCEHSGVTLMTITMKHQDGREMHSRTRKVEIVDVAAEPVPFKKSA